MYLDWERTREKDYDSQLCIRGLFYITENGKYGLSSRNMTDFLIAPVYDDIILNYSSDRYIKVCKNNKWGLLRFDGTVFADVVYDTIEHALFPSNNNLIEAVKDGIEGFILPDGTWVDNFPCVDSATRLDYAYASNNELFKWKHDGKYGVLNQKLQWVFPPIYDTIEVAYNLVMAEQMGKRFFMDFAGNIIPDCPYDRIGRISYVNSKESYYTAVQIGDKFGILDNQRNLIFSPIYGSCFPTAYIHDSCVFYTNHWKRGQKTATSKKYGLINFENGHISELKFSGCCDEFSEGVIPLPDIYNKWGFADKDGNWVIQPQYTAALPFVDGKAVVQKGTSVVQIDKSNCITKTLLTNVDDEPFRCNNKKSMIIQQRNGKSGVLSSKGDIVIPFQYDEMIAFDKIIIAFKEDAAYANCVYCYFDEKISCLGECNNFSIAYQEDYEYIITQKDGRYGIIYDNGAKPICIKPHLTCIPNLEYALKNSEPSTYLLF